MKYCPKHAPKIDPVFAKEIEDSMAAHKDMMAKERQRDELFEKILQLAELPETEERKKQIAGLEATFALLE